MKLLKLLVFILIAAAAPVFAQLPSPAQALFREAVAEYAAGRYKNAETKYTTYLKLRPNDSNAYYNRGLALFMQKEYLRAIDDYSKSLSISPNDPSVLVARGQTYGILTQTDRSKYGSLAVADLTAVLKAKPNYSAALQLRGKAFYEMSNYDGAIADLTAALRLDPKNTEALFDRGRSYTFKDQFALARADFAAIKRLEPNHAYAGYWIEWSDERLAAKNTKPTPTKPSTSASAKPPAAKPSQTAQVPSTSAKTTAPPTAPTASNTGNDLENETKNGDRYMAARQFDRAITSYKQALALLPSPELAILALPIQNERSSLNQKIAVAYVGKNDIANGISTCLDSTTDLHKQVTDSFREFGLKPPIESSRYVEDMKIRLDSRITDLDLYLISAERSVQIAKSCLGIAGSAKLEDEVLLVKSISIGLLKASISEIVATALTQAGSFRRTVSDICKRSSASVCLTSSNRNATETYASKSLEQLSKAIQLDPGKKTAYLERAKTYRVIGNEQLAAADDAKAATMNDDR